MKKLILVLAAILSFTCINAQESKVYRISQTEWYLYNEVTKKWDLQTQNKNTSIDLVSYKNVINIQAKTPTLYRLDETSKREIGGDEYRGYRYDAIECVNMEKCTVDIVVMPGTEIFLLSVITDKEDFKANLRFYGKFVQ